MVDKSGRFERGTVLLERIWLLCFDFNFNAGFTKK
jgi:hypothetical protein